MAAAAEERIPALTSGEKIFSLAVPFAAVASERRIGANKAWGEKPHQGIFSKNRGDRISEICVKYSGTHRLSGQWWSETALGIALDANGNTLSDAQGRSFTWDFENRLTQAVVPGTNGGTTTFRYDPFGRRIQKSGPLGTTNYLYDGANPAEEVDGSGNLVLKYTQGVGIDDPMTMLRAGTTSFYQADALGSVTSLSNLAGALANTYSYDSFGKLTASTGTLTNAYGFTGRELDLETDLYYYRFRYYDQNVGRFVSEDPGRFPGGINFYSYVENDPVDLVDPFGFCPWQIHTRPLKGLPMLPHYYFYNTQTGQSMGLGPAAGVSGGTVAGTPVPGTWETNEKPGHEVLPVPDWACNCVSRKVKNPGKPPNYCTYQGNGAHNPNPVCTNCIGWTGAVLQDCYNQAYSGQQ
jgi:RHS repeat-associated protein